MSEQMSDRYSPQEVEGEIYKWWEQKGYFKADAQSPKPPYSIILPPPNVTGHLHLGHALDHTIQDVLVRWRRMSGDNALWLPGTDHAGIATQSVVERELKKENITRLELGREKFLEKVWDWRNQYGDRIYNQMKRLGDSVDWDRKTFTLDPGVSDAVKKVFVTLYKKGLIYKGLRLVNWSSPLQTAISDLEVEHKEQKGSLWHIRYPVVGSDEVLVVATTRPETLLGDTAVCVHPEDERYKHLIGQSVRLPLTDRTIPVIADDYVDKDFGSGVVKITPAHDFNDYQVGQRHQLPLINILNKDGTLNENAGEFKGLKVQEARKRVLEKLEADQAIEKIEPHKNKVGYCSRSGAVVEPFLSEQWFLKMDGLAKPARDAVESGKLKFIPESWTKVYLHWMNIIEDWCISRQLWWGHRIPAWHCSNCQHITVSETSVSQCEKCGSTSVQQDEDVLDTWFSSALWPFSTMGWPNSDADLKKFYPTSVLVTGHDIIFFWVSRMIMMGMEFQKDIPFETVYIHGLIRDSDGKKMSKSLGNSIDPIEMIEQYGADALRYNLMASLSPGRDIKFSEKRVEGYRNFMNKIWNATRFALGALQDFKTFELSQLNRSDLSLADQWIIKTTEDVERSIDQDLKEFRFQEASNKLYQFIWKDVCDWYLEFSKPVLYGAPSAQRTATQMVMAQTLNRIMRLIHPFAPFISEEIYKKLPIRSEALITESYPTVENDQAWLKFGDETARVQMDVVKEAITAIRNIRGETQIKPNQEIQVQFVTSNDSTQKILMASENEIKRLARLSGMIVAPQADYAQSAVATVKVDAHIIEVVVSLAGLIDIESEVKRLQKAFEKLEKESMGLERRLGDQKYLVNAPEELVEADQEQLSFLKAEKANIESRLKRLS